MDVKTYSEVLSSPLSQRGSAVFLLQTDQNLVLWFGHVKYILQHGKKYLVKIFICTHRSCGEEMRSEMTPVGSVRRSSCC